MASLKFPGKPDNYVNYLRSYLVRNGSAYGEDHYEGWFLGKIFSIGYISSHSFSKYNAVRNRAVGYIKEDGTGSKVVWFRFQGYTDPFSLILVFLCCFITLFCVRNMGGIIQGPIGVVFEYSLIFTVATALVTWFSTQLTSEGKIGHDRLLDLFYPERIEKRKAEEEAARMQKYL